MTAFGKKNHLFSLYYATHIVIFSVLHKVLISQDYSLTFSILDHMLTLVTV
jgi:hypothetical protein